MVKIPRQSIYKLGILKGLFTIFSGGLRKSKLGLESFFYYMIKIKPLFIGRARVGISICVQESVRKNQKKVVLMSPLTILDLVNMVIAGGGEPEFYDLNPNNFEIDFLGIKNRLAKGDVSAVIITHYYFISSHIKDLVNLCNEYDVKIIEDCAISLGFSDSKGFAGQFGDFSVFSLSLFKFMNFFSGGVIFAKNYEDYKKLKSLVEGFEKMELLDYKEQIYKYLKFGLASSKIIYQLVFYFFKFGIKNNISFITKNVQNDPTVPVSGLIPLSHYRVPSDLFYTTIFNKLGYFQTEMNNRCVKAQLYHQIAVRYDLNLIESLDAPLMPIMNYPIKFLSKEKRNDFVLFMLDAGVDISVQIYRNLKSVDGYSKFVGNTSGVSEIVNTVAYLPMHAGVSILKCEKIGKLVERYFQKKS